MLISKKYVKVSGMDFERFLNKSAEKINRRVEKILNETQQRMGGYSARLEELFREFSQLTLEGKRIRGALVLAGYEYAGGTDSERVLDGAAAVEIFQTSILAQDDLIDKSETRRGRPALHIKLGGDHIAISQTICLSDLGIFLSVRLLSGLKVREDLKVKGINFFSQTLMQTVAGEMLDIELSKRGELEGEEVIKIGLLKTARYTISGPLILGALLAGAELTTVKKLQNFGDNLGIAFQIQDDILGIFGNEKETGKSSLSDIKEGKATLLFAHALKNAEYKKLLSKIYGNEDVTEKGAEKVRKVFKESGALDFAIAEAQKYMTAAREALKEERQDLLYSLVNFIEGRKK